MQQQQRLLRWWRFPCGSIRPISQSSAVLLQGCSSALAAVYRVVWRVRRQGRLAVEVVLCEAAVSAG